MSFGFPILISGVLFSKFLSNGWEFFRSLEFQTGYPSESTGSSVTSRRFFLFHWPRLHNISEQLKAAPFSKRGSQTNSYSSQQAQAVTRNCAWSIDLQCCNYCHFLSGVSFKFSIIHESTSLHENLGCKTYWTLFSELAWISSKCQSSMTLLVNLVMWTPKIMRKVGKTRHIPKLMMLIAKSTQ